MRTTEKAYRLAKAAAVEAWAAVGAANEAAIKGGAAAAEVAAQVRAAAKAASLAENAALVAWRWEKWVSSATPEEVAEAMALEEGEP